MFWTIEIVITSYGPTIRRSVANPVKADAELLRLNWRIDNNLKDKLAILVVYLDHPD